MKLRLIFLSLTILAFLLISVVFKVFKKDKTYQSPKSTDGKIETPAILKKDTSNKLNEKGLNIKSQQQKYFKPVRTKESITDFTNFFQEKANTNNIRGLDFRSLQLQKYNLADIDNLEARFKVPVILFDKDYYLEKDPGLKKNKKFDSEYDILLISYFAYREKKYDPCDYTYPLVSNIKIMSEILKPEQIKYRQDISYDVITSEEDNIEHYQVGFIPQDIVDWIEITEDEAIQIANDFGLLLTPSGYWTSINPSDSSNLILQKGDAYHYEPAYYWQIK